MEIENPYMKQFMAITEKRIDKQILFPKFNETDDTWKLAINEATLMGLEEETLVEGQSVWETELPKIYALIFSVHKNQSYKPGHVLVTFKDKE